ncbi:succinyl-diaminopimelate desuccinylase [Capillimicrobium parvum]|uniref:Succinyl-diaminopimelate desuccinylase n=1 Tax=Capillimicrobium parvum TaxID=2884022 RepID=A0A9E7C1P9_9ACTN|nr:succinyl-diaminopimelate desuccinylase [Capillimicrobium parvum]UGS36658.1 Putative succinyl-diaminopimelate desuccinylase DapE [Capillimicrobium parvum]
MPDLPGRLARRTLELVDLPSVSRSEQRLAAHVLEVLRSGGADCRAAGDTCVLAGATERGARPLVLLAGHLDTVPEQGNLPGAIVDGRVVGLGAADMKGADAVMIELAIALAGRETAVDVGFVFFGREELPFAESALTPLLEREPGLAAADLVVVMEPTANALQLGCLGNLNATWTFSGRAGHSARPWLADNAIHRAAEGIHALAQVGPVEHRFGGLTYTEVVSATTISGGIAQNVVPDRAVAQVNYRFPPGRGAAEAEAQVRAWCEPYGAIEITGIAPSGPVPDANPLVARLQESGAGEVAAKQAWTPVAEFGLAGVDAVNFGPGDPVHAHRADEEVSVAALVECFSVLERFLCG